MLTVTELQWSKDKHYAEDSLYTAMLPDGGRLTVLDRLTGYGGGIRDVETGYRDADGKFWLASGGNDIREVGWLSVDQAVEWVKTRANTCVGA